jgi:glycosyltransferase involved in cell wall biosynthesis
MKQIKIAHIITDLDIGGAEMMLLKMLRNFESDKYEHFVISLKPTGSIGKMLKNDNLRTYTLNLNKYNFAASFLKLISILKKEKPEIVQNYLFHADILGRVAAKLMRIPVVISSLRSVEIGGRLRERLLGITDFCVNMATAVSQEVANVHISKGTTKRKIRVIHNGVELGNSHPGNRSSVKRAIGLKDSTFLLLTIGRLEGVKGHSFLFRALELLKKKDYEFKLLVVGRGRQRENLKEEIINRRLEDKVILTGEREDIQGLLTASDAFILPSLWEGLPNVLLEAMAAGLPVIATRVGGIPEVVTHNETGLLVEVKDSTALAEAIGRIVKEDGLRERLAQNAKDCVRKNFDIKKTVAETESLYGELLTEYGKK